MVRSPDNTREFDKDKSAEYASILAEIIRSLKAKIKAGEPGILYRDNPELRDLFRGKNKIITEDDFVSRLRQIESSSVIRATDFAFTFKEFYPVHNRQQLVRYLLEKGDIGIKDNYKLWLCYDGVRADIESLIEEGWIRVIVYSDAKKGQKNVAKMEQEKKKRPD